MLEALRSLCGPGGAVLMHEPFGAFHYAGAHSGALEKLLALATAAYHAEGVDMQAGRRLTSRLAAAGLTDVVERRARVALPAGHPYLRLPLMLADALGDDILDLGTVASPICGSCGSWRSTRRGTPRCGRPPSSWSARSAVSR